MKKREEPTLSLSEKTTIMLIVIGIILVFFLHYISNFEYVRELFIAIHFSSLTLAGILVSSNLDLLPKFVKKKELRLRIFLIAMLLITGLTSTLSLLFHSIEDYPSKIIFGIFSSITLSLFFSCILLLIYLLKKRIESLH